MGKLDGRCLCGAVTSSSEADSAFIGMCHCTDCQRVTGSAFAIEVAVPWTDPHESRPRFLRGPAG